MNCPSCHSCSYSKAGFVKNKQRFKCKNCNYYYTVSLKSTAKNSHVKRIAIELYLEGFGFNSIGRILNVSHVSVQQWCKLHSLTLEKLKNDGSIKSMSLKEAYIYLQKKKPSETSGLLLIDIGENTSQSFWIFGKETQVRSYGKRNRIKQ